MNKNLRNDQSGITLLITLLLMGVLLGIGATLLNITLKQLQLSSIALESEIAFQAANAGVECALYYDFVSTAGAPFDVFGNGTGRSPLGSLNCMNDDSGDNIGGNGVACGSVACGIEDEVESGEEQKFRFEWSNLCTEVSVYKFYMEDDGDGNAESVDVEVNGEDMRPGAPCPEGSECTVIQSRGYNVRCSDITVGGRVVEREYTQVY